MTTRAQLDAYFERVPEHVLTVLDQAYFEYIEHPDYPDGIAEYAKAGRRVLVLRTFSKIYGLAGLRVGYGVGPTDVIEAIGKTRRAFDVNTQAQVAALASMDGAGRAGRAAPPHARGTRDARADAPRARARAGRSRRRELPLRRGRGGRAAALRGAAPPGRDRPSDGRVRRTRRAPDHGRHAGGERVLRRGARLGPGGDDLAVGYPGPFAGARRPRLAYADDAEERHWPRGGRERERPAGAPARRALADHDLPPAGAAAALAAGRRCARSSRGCSSRCSSSSARSRAAPTSGSTRASPRSSRTTPDVKIAAKRLDVALPGQPATALVVGYDRRAGEGAGTRSRSDTIMLVRADPDTESISLLSFPRDLFVEIDCPGRATFNARINGAYSECGTKGTLETVRELTGAADQLPDHRQLPRLPPARRRRRRHLARRRPALLQRPRRRLRLRDDQPLPGLPEARRLPGARLRPLPAHRLRSLPRRPAAAVRAGVQGPDQVERRPARPAEDREDDHEERRGRRRAATRRSTSKTVLRYALFAYGLPPGHFFQAKLEGIEETRRLRPARARGEHPEGRAGVLAPRRRVAGEGDGGRARREAEGPKNKAPPPRETTVTVLNGNGVTGSAGTASYLLSQRGYQMVYPPDGKNANAPNWEYFKTQIHYDPAQRGRGGCRQARSRTSSAPTTIVPTRRKIAALSNGAMLTVIVGQTFHGTLAEAPVDKTPQRQQAERRSGRGRVARAAARARAEAAASR